MVRFALALILASRTGASQDAGSKACQACHPAHFDKQSATGHARSLRMTADHPLAERFSPLLRFRPEWAFGGGLHAVTFVSWRDSNAYLEHHLSFYPALGKLDVTPGHEGKPAPGVLYPVVAGDTAILRCFRCHSTGAIRVTEGLRIGVAEPGVRCESCHGPGVEHVAKPGLGNIVNPARYSAAEMNEMCGSCHRKPASTGDNTDWGNAWNVRHQPLYLAESTCFVKSSGRLSCKTCHDPHSGAVTPSCDQCHARPKHRPATRVSGSTCVSCHMPGVVPRPGLKFANHWIGVYAPGRPLRPVQK